MKKLLGIVVIGLCGITRFKRDKTRKVKAWIKKTLANSGKLFRKLVIIYKV